MILMPCRFKPAVAPLKAAVFPLVQQKDLDVVARRISAKLRRAGLPNTVDTTGGNQTELSHHDTLIHTCR